MQRCRCVCRYQQREGDLLLIQALQLQQDTNILHVKLQYLCREATMPCTLQAVFIWPLGEAAAERDALSLERTKTFLQLLHAFLRVCLAAYKLFRQLCCLSASNEVYLEVQDAAECKRAHVPACADSQAMLLALMCVLAECHIPSSHLRWG